MMPYHAYQVLQAERTKTAAASRAADVRLGEMAAAMAHLAGELARPVRASRRLFHRMGTQEGDCRSRPAVAEPVRHRYG